MSEQVQRVSREISLQADHFPLHVRRTTHSTATGRIAHDVTKLMLVNSGTTIIRHAAGSLALHEGQLALLSAGHWYAGEPLGRVVTTTVYIDTTFLQEQARWIPESNASGALFLTHKTHPVPVTVDLSGPEIPLLDSVLWRLIDSQLRSESVFHRFSHVAELFNVLTRRDSSHHFEHEVVHQAATLLLEGMEDAWTIEKLADAVSMSSSQITRLFRQHLGAGPAEFLRTQRGLRMAKLLVASSDAVEVIARQVGWLDASHASRAFRQIHGITPTQYRISRPR